MRILFNIFFLMYSFLLFSQSDWELEKEEDGIKIYTRVKEGYKVKEYKATMLLKTSKERLLEVILKGDSLHHWTYKTDKSKLLKKESDSVYYVYMYNDFPWPVKNRDHISKLTVTYPDNLSIKINIESSPSFIEEKEGILRVTKFIGHWLFVEKDNGVQVTQQLAGDPGGYLPNFVVNSMLVKAPLNTFLNLKKVLE